MQEAFGETWVLYDLSLLVAMLVCLVTYIVYVQTLAQFQPQNTYEVYDSLGGAQAHVLLPKKVDPTALNSESWFCCCALSHARNRRSDVKWHPLVTTVSSLCPAAAC